MTKPRTLIFTALSLSCVALVLSSCDGDDDTIGTSGGSAGKAAGGGSAGTAGASSGRGGGGGRTGGRGGDAGSPEGGAAASVSGGAGAGAQSGSGGTLSSGGTGNVSTAGQQSVAGNGAEAGSSGNGGAGAGGAPNDGLLTCHTGCTTSDDCESLDLEGHCDETLHLCVECTAHADCIPKANGWNLACTADADCTDLFLTACVEVGGSGRCAAPPDPSYGCFFGIAQPYPRFGIDPVETVDVCVADSGRCTAEHLCVTGCTDVADFCTSVSLGYGDTCNETTGQCNCATDDECTAGPSPHCNPVTHLCDECATGDDCSAATTGQDVCKDGRCGCSSISACPASSFPAGTPLCE